MFVHGCEKFLPALAYLFCLALPGYCLTRFTYFFWEHCKRASEAWTLCTDWGQEERFMQPSLHLFLHMCLYVTEAKSNRRRCRCVSLHLWLGWPASHSLLSRTSLLLSSALFVSCARCLSVCLSVCLPESYKASVLITPLKHTWRRRRNNDQCQSGYPCALLLHQIQHVERRLPPHGSFKIVLKRVGLQIQNMKGSASLQAMMRKEAAVAMSPTFWVIDNEYCVHTTHIFVSPDSR